MTASARSSGSRRTTASLRALAEECRQLATRADMENVAAALNEMAFDYDRQADRADTAEARTRGLLTGPRPA